jgi:hypothetical protein
MLQASPLSSPFTIVDCRLSIAEVVWQLLPMPLSLLRRENRQSKTGNSSYPGPSDDRRKSSPHEKKMNTSAAARHSGNQKQILRYAALRSE